MTISSNLATFEAIKTRILEWQKVESIQDVDFNKLCEKTKVKPNSLRRFLNEYKGLRRSKVLIKLEECFGLPDCESRQSLTTNSLPPVLIKTLARVWDGSDRHAKQIAWLIRTSHFMSARINLLKGKIV